MFSPHLGYVVKGAAAYLGDKKSATFLTSLTGMILQVVIWLVVEPTHLKNISQNGNLPRIGVNIKNV